VPPHARSRLGNDPANARDTGRDSDARQETDRLQAFRLIHSSRGRYHDGSIRALPRPRTCVLLRTNTGAYRDRLFLSSETPETLLSLAKNAKIVESLCLQPPGVLSRKSPCTGRGDFRTGHVASGHLSRRGGTARQGQILFFARRGLSVEARRMKEEAREKSTGLTLSEPGACWTSAFPQCVRLEDEGYAG